MSYLETKPGSLEEAIRRTDEDYQAMFKKELEKTGKSIGQMTPDEKKKFFNKIDKMHGAKNEAKVDELTKAQEKLPPALQKAIKKKEMKEEEVPANVKKIAKELDKAVDMHKSQAQRLRKAGIEEKKHYSSQQIKQAYGIANDKRYKHGNMTGAVKAIEKIAKGLSKHPDVENVLKRTQEQIQEEEGMTDKGKNKVASLKTKLDKEKDTDALEAQITDLKGQIALLKTQLENEKNATVKPEPNPETGEVPLTVGIAYKHLRDKMKKEEEKKDTKKTAVGSKANKVDTKPEVEFDK